MRMHAKAPQIEKKIENPMTIIDYSFGRMEFRAKRIWQWFGQSVEYIS